MRKVLLLLAMSVIMFACNDNESKETTFHGKWLLFEQKIGTGPAGVWEPLQQPIGIGSIQLKLYLNADSTFSAPERPSTFGKYSIKGQIISFTNEGTDESDMWSNRFEFDEFLTLSPSEPMCDEGCEYKYKRL